MAIRYAVMFRTETEFASWFQIRQRLNLTHDSLAVLQFCVFLVRSEVRLCGPSLTSREEPGQPLTRTVETTRGFSTAITDCSTFSHLYSCLQKSCRICQTS